MLNSLKVAVVEFANGKYQVILCPLTRFAIPYYAPEETRSGLRDTSRTHPNQGRSPGARGGGRILSPHHATSGFSF